MTFSSFLASVGPTRVEIDKNYWNGLIGTSNNKVEAQNKQMGQKTHFWPMLELEKWTDFGAKSGGPQGDWGHKIARNL